jgi:gliding motility-associated-like protein
VVTALTINNAVTTNLSTTSCDSASVNGNWYFTSQTVTDSFTTSLGCDSIVVTALTINNAVTTNLATISCDSASVNGSWYYASQTVTDSFSTSNGCDSIVLTALIINNSSVAYDTVYACKFYEVRTKRYMSSQQITLKYVNNQGCDSTVYCQLYIMDPAQLDVSLVGCDSVSYGNEWYYNTASFKDTIIGIGAICDTIYNVQIEVNKSYYVEHHSQNCYLTIVDGIEYTSSTIVYKNNLTQHGCDSTDIYHIVISSPIKTSEELIGCDVVNYNGTSFTSSTVAVDTLMSMEGCDSIHTTYITVMHSSSTQKSVNICEGNSYTLSDGRQITSSGTYTSTLINMNGCDSIVVEEINIYEREVKPVSDLSKCLGDDVYFDISVWDNFQKIKWNTGEENTGILLTEYRNYFVELTDVNGCVQSDTITLSDEKCETCPVFIASAFTPNGNTLNESFSPQHDCEFKDYQFSIYNRWGERLFETRDTEAVWNGVYKGEVCQQDVYVWILYYVDKSTLESITKKGTVTLLR